jgi:hypothetical protein
MTNVVPIRRPVPKLRVPMLPELSGPLNIEIPEPLASLIRTQSAWANKPPEKFVYDFISSAFPELNAG